eukprot:323237_1
MYGTVRAVIRQTSPTGIVETSGGYCSVQDHYQRFNKRQCNITIPVAETYVAYDSVNAVDVLWHKLHSDFFQQMDSIQLHMLTLKELDHPNIIKIRDLWVQSNYICYITDMLHTRTLQECCHKKQFMISMNMLKQVCKQILSVLSYLHDRNIIHTNVKCDQIFIDCNTGRILFDVFVDAMKYSDIGSRRHQGIGFSIHWMAPELYTDEFDHKVDIWAFGICILELITQEKPYSECRNVMRMYGTITSGEKPKSLQKICDADARDFISICLHMDPLMRPTAQELLQHPFLQDIEDSKSDDTFLMSHLIHPFERLCAQGTDDPDRWAHLSPKDIPLVLRKVNGKGLSNSVVASLHKTRKKFLSQYDAFVTIQLEIFKLKITNITLSNDQNLFAAKTEVAAQLQSKIKAERQSIRMKWNELVADRKEISKLNFDAILLYQCDPMRAELIVIGCLRQMQKSLFLLPNHANVFHYIPQDIQFIIYSYYLLRETWHPTLQRAVTVLYNICNSSIKGGTVFGVKVIQCGRHQWKFRTKKINSRTMNIGIVESNASTANALTRIANALVVPYVGYIELKPERDDRMTVKMRINRHDTTRTLSIEFQFRPYTENVDDVIDEMVNELAQVNRSRKQEIVDALNAELQALSNPWDTSCHDSMDDVEMMFDYDNSLLEFTVNGKLCKTQELKSNNKSYRMGITFNDHPTQIELVEYRQL